MYQLFNSDMEISTYSKSIQTYVDSTINFPLIFTNIGKTEAVYTVKYSIKNAKGEELKTETTEQITTAMLSTESRAFEYVATLPGEYTIEYTIILEGDGLTSNNTATTKFTVYPNYWKYVNSGITTPTYMGSSVGVTKDNKNYLFSLGGNTNNSVNTEVSIYNVEEDKWRAGKALPEKSVVGGAVVVGDFIYFNSGSDGNATQSTFYKYSITDSTYTKLKDTPSPISWNKLVAINGNIYTIGYRNNNNVKADSVFRYNIESNTWTKASRQKNVLQWPGVCVVNGKIVCVGGIDVSDDEWNASSKVQIGTIDQNNPDTIVWTEGKPCPSTLAKVEARNWYGNQIIATSGDDNWNPVNNTWIYDLDCNNWFETTQKITSTLAYAAATFNIDGKLRYYVATGYDGINGNSRLEYYTAKQKYTYSLNVKNEGQPVKDAVLIVDNNIFLTDENGNAFVLLEDGEYPYEVFIDGSSIKTGTIVINGQAVSQNVTNIATVNIEKSNISVYPNPTSSYLNISNVANAQITIYNIDGKQVYSSKNVNADTKVDVSNLANGFYFVKISENSKNTIQKINIVR